MIGNSIQQTSVLHKRMLTQQGKGCSLWAEVETSKALVCFSKPMYCLPRASKALNCNIDTMPSVAFDAKDVLPKRVPV